MSIYVNGNARLVTSLAKNVKIVQEKKIQNCFAVWTGTGMDLYLKTLT